jgi:hypothetical protein
LAFEQSLKIFTTLSERDAVMRKFLVARAFFALISLFFLMLPFQVVWAAAKPASSETVMAGPYIIDIDLSQNPPVTDQPFEVIVVPHDYSPQLSGQVIAKPGLGTDAVNLYTPLKPAVGQHSTLEGSLHVPVQGAWEIVVQLNGPQGHGSGSITITAAALGAIPVWLGWLIGTIPAMGFIWWLWHQRRYRRTLVAVESTQ